MVAPVAFRLVQPVYQEGTEDLEQEGLAVRSAETLERDLFGNCALGKSGRGCSEQLDRSRFVKERKFDLTGADEMVVPDAIEFVEGRCSGHQQAHSSAVLNRGTKQTHQLKELVAAAREERFEALELVDGDEDAAIAQEAGRVFPATLPRLPWAGRLGAAGSSTRRSRFAWIAPVRPACSRMSRLKRQGAPGGQRIRRRRQAAFAAAFSAARFCPLGAGRAAAAMRSDWRRQGCSRSLGLRLAAPEQLGTCSSERGWPRRNGFGNQAVQRSGLRLHGLANVAKCPKRFVEGLGEYVAVAAEADSIERSLS